MSTESWHTSWSWLLDISCLLYALFCVLRVISKPKKGLRHPPPPGPKGYPFIGNLFDMPDAKTQVGRKFAEWGETYGPISSANVFGQTFIVLNDHQAVQQLLDTRGSIYSDRHQSAMSKLSNFNIITPLLSYNDTLKDHRKLMAQAIGTNQSIKRYYPRLEQQSVMLLKRILRDPRNFNQAIKRSTGSALLASAYGYTPNEEGKDELLEMTDGMVARFAEMHTPGRFLVDMLPSLQYLPRWLPSPNAFRAYAESASSLLSRLIDLPMEFVRNQADSSLHCYVSDLLSNPRSRNKERMIAVTASNMYGAGTDTMKAAVLNYFLAMVLNPQIQKKLQNEIDTVIGNERLPTFQDRDSLPYLQAVFKECFRWLPAFPIALPHQVSCDDVYEGFFIPKGSIVIANVWKLLHDPETYADPLTFNPDRFLGSNPETDPFSYCFGFGRRVCPGLNLANAIVWVFLAKVAATLEISKAVGSDGKGIEPACDQTPGAVSEPVPFECQIMPRHGQVSRLIEDALTEMF